jgi:sulfotransferase family protein
MRSNVVCIIGMHRSGTSMVANLLQLCGLSLGPEQKLMGPSTSNPKGHFEHSGFLKINEALFRHLGGSWDNPPELKPGWEGNAALDAIVRDAEALVKNFADHSHWGWKEPRTTILVPFWKRVIPDLRFVICIRNPIEVARSVAKRNGLSVSGSAYLWNLYTQAAIRDTADCHRVLSFYQDFFRSPREELSRVAKFCNLEVPADWSVVEQSISNELRNQSIRTSELLDETAIPSEYKLWYLATRAIVHDETVTGTDECATLGRISLASGKLLALMDKFSSEQQIAHLQAMIAKKDQEWSARMMQELASKDIRISELQTNNERLQLFSDAVRRTWVYRFYSKILKPLRSQ